MSALSDALNEANRENWSAAEIARRSGDLIHRATAANVMRGKHATNPSEEVLQAFADVFRIPVQDLRELAGQPAGESDPYVPPAEAARLDARQRRAVDEIIRSMVSGDASLPAYLVGVFDSLTAGETAQFLRDLRGTTRERLDYLWRQRKQWVNDGGLPIWDRSVPDTSHYRVARDAYEEHIFQLTPDEMKGRPPEEWQEPIKGPEPRLEPLLEAARRGTANLRSVKAQQDQAGEAADLEGPEGGA